MSRFREAYQGGDSIRLMASGKKFEVNDVGTFSLPDFRHYLKAGDVGYITASMKNVRDTNVGDTVLADRR